MQLPELASLIIDTYDTFDPDEMISISAEPDRQIISQYYCDPRNSASLLKDYNDSQLEKLVSGCNSLADVTAKVSKLYYEQPLEPAEASRVKARCCQAVLAATYDIAMHRDLGGCRNAHEAILALVVQEFKSYLSTFQQ